MFGLGLPEIIVIALAVSVVLFGGKKVVEISRSLGRASGEFKKGKQEIEKELKDAEQSVSVNTEATKNQHQSVQTTEPTSTEEDHKNTQQ